LVLFSFSSLWHFNYIIQVLCNETRLTTYLTFLLTGGKCITWDSS
jgi:hypothetical protein